MCGILGFLTSDESLLSLKIIMTCLEELKNRGYDSIGMSILHDQHFDITKSIGQDSISILFQKYKYKIIQNCIAHTRWATHGKISVENAHPHLDTILEAFTIVHNGVIENFQELYSFLVSKQVLFRSETDTEVFVNLLSFYHSLDEDDDPEQKIIRSILKTVEKIEGTFGIIIQWKEYKDRLYCIRRGSPLLIGIDQEGKKILLLSEKQAFPLFITKYLVCKPNQLYVCDLQSDAFIKTIDIPIERKDPFSFSNQIFENNTHQEIFDQIQISKKISKNSSRISNHYPFIRLGGLSLLPDVSRFYFFGCGTSYHACLILKYLCSSSRVTDTVDCFDASECDPTVITIQKPAIGVFLSQSGETRDLMNVISWWKSMDQNITIGITNVVDSQLTLETDAGIYMNVGKEKGVASTKSFTGQVLCGILFLCWVFQRKQRHDLIIPYIHGIQSLDTVLEDFIPKIFLETRILVQESIHVYQNFFIMGRGIDSLIAKEASLKIKEISYRHVEAYPAGSLKHGPFALLDSNFPVFFILSDESKTSQNKKTIHNIYEVLTRNAPCFVVTTQKIQQDISSSKITFILIPHHFYSFLLANIVFQCIAYHLCVHSGHNPDFPKNLAKVVTVE